jgi:hypothetical protein
MAQRQGMGRVQCGFRRCVAITTCAACTQAAPSQPHETTLFRPVGRENRLHSTTSVQRTLCCPHGGTHLPAAATSRATAAACPVRARPLRRPRPPTGPLTPAAPASGGGATQPAGASPCPVPGALTPLHSPSPRLSRRLPHCRCRRCRLWRCCGCAAAAPPSSASRGRGAGPCHSTFCHCCCSRHCLHQTRCCCCVRSCCCWCCHPCQDGAAVARPSLDDRPLARPRHRCCCCCCCCQAG